MYINKSAASRILGCEVTKIWTMPNGAIGCVYIKNGKKCSTLISAKKFKTDFIEFRKEGAKTVTVTRWGFGSYRNHFDCLSDGNHYTVKFLGNVVTCNCADFDQQEKDGYSKPICKHIIATVQSLNVSSFSEAVNKVVG